MLNFFKKGNTESLNMDAWSDGQVASKIWLCQKVEETLSHKNEQSVTIWIYGSWYGTLAYLLLSRERLKIKKICCFDIDKNANRIAAKILNHWTLQDVQIEIYNQDCQEITPHSSYYANSEPDLIINTSCEHMRNYTWWEQIPTGTMFALQSTNMVHPTHINCVRSLEEFQNLMKPSLLFVADEKKFSYPSLKFSRYMLIGEKS